MKVGIGRFGPYISHDSKFYSIGKEDDPYEINSDRAIEIIFAKRKAEAEKHIMELPNGIMVLNGRFGPYFTQNKENYKIPKGTDPKSLTLEQCEKIISETKSNPKAKSSFRGKKK